MLAEGNAATINGYKSQGGVRTVVGVAVALAVCWVGWEISVVLRDGPASLPGSAKAERVRNLALVTDGVLDKGWLARTLAIPADAKNVTEAYELINYLYRPDVAAKNSDFLSYANGNLASQKLVEKDKVLAVMRGFQATMGDDFKPAALLERLVSEGKGFKDL